MMVRLPISACFLLGLAACTPKAAALEEQFAHGTPEASLEARHALIVLGGPDAVAVFARYLTPAAGAHRLPAITGMASLIDGVPEALPLLFPLLEDPSAEIRYETLCHLAYRDLPALLPKLAELSGDTDARIRELAIEELDRVGAGDARPLFIKAAQDPDPKVRKAAGTAILRQDWLLRALEIRYHPPTATPYAVGTPDEAAFLKSHRDGWDWLISYLREETIDAGNPNGASATCCEAPVPVTKGWYAGQADASGFSEAVGRRMASDPALKARFKTYWGGLVRERDKEEK